MKIIYQIGIIFSICWVSQIVEALLPFAFPASVIGMVLLFVLLAFRVLKVEHIQEKSEVLQSTVWKLLIICLLTTILTFAATAGSIRLTLKLMALRKGGNGNG